MKKITHLIFSGNGFNSLSLLGVLRYIYFNKLEENIHNVAGTSMGSFFCLAFALKIPFEELEIMINEFIINEDNLIIKKEDFNNLFIKNGLDKTIIYLNSFKNYIKKKYDLDDMTFIELSKKTGINLYVSSVNINKCENVIFNINDTPNVSIFDAVASSMSIPFISEPVLIDGYYYIDGALINNFPIEVFKNIPNDNILGVIYIIDKNYKSNEIPKDTYIPLLTYSLQVLHILICNTTKISLISKFNEDNVNDYLIIRDSHMDGPISFFLNKDYIKKKLTVNDIDKFIFQGYKEIHNYMNKYLEL